MCKCANEEIADGGFRDEGCGTKKQGIKPLPEINFSMNPAFGTVLRNNRQNIPSKTPHMKNRLLPAFAALLIAASANAQSTVDSIAAKYSLLPMPQPLTLEQKFPVLGTYELSNGTESSTALTVSIDPENKGIVWIEGLPQGRVKAYLRKSPATYRIPAQKTEAGKTVPEGTLIFDKETSTLNVSLGAPFNEADPAAVFAHNNSTQGKNVVEVKKKSDTYKYKAKITYYTAVKQQQQAAAGGTVDTNR